LYAASSASLPERADSGVVLLTLSAHVWQISCGVQIMLPVEVVHDGHHHECLDALTVSLLEVSSSVNEVLVDLLLVLVHKVLHGDGTCDSVFVESVDLLLTLSPLVTDGGNTGCRSIVCFGHGFLGDGATHEGHFDCLVFFGYDLKGNSGPHAVLLAALFAEVTDRVELIVFHELLSVEILYLIALFLEALHLLSPLVFLLENCLGLALKNDTATSVISIRSYNCVVDGLVHVWHCAVA
jgi:hypothetical protein